MKLTAEQTRELFITALRYGIENFASNIDYSKYISKDFVITIDNEVFNYPQWVQHIQNVKAMMKKMQVTFSNLVIEGNNIASSHIVLLQRHDGDELMVKVIGIFQLEDNKLIAGEEYTNLIKGDNKYRNIAITR